MNKDNRDDSVDVQFTDAATRYLDDVVQQYRDQITTEVEKSAASRGLSQRATVSDVRNALASVVPPSFADRATSQTWRFRRNIVVVLGVLVGAGLGALFAGILAELQGRSEPPPTWVSVAGLVAALGGMAASVTAATLAIRAQRAARKSGTARGDGARSTELVLRFSELERLATTTAAQVLGEEAVAGRRPTLSGVVNELARRGLWGDEDVREFRQIVQLRNEIVHEQRSVLSEAELEDASRKIRELEYRLREGLSRAASI